MAPEATDDFELTNRYDQARCYSPIVLKWGTGKMTFRLYVTDRYPNEPTLAIYTKWWDAENQTRKEAKHFRLDMVDALITALEAARPYMKALGDPARLKSQGRIKHKTRKLLNFLEKETIKHLKAERRRDAGASEVLDVRVANKPPEVFAAIDFNDL